jgi:hypothetical protein
MLIIFLHHQIDEAEALEELEEEEVVVEEEAIALGEVTFNASIVINMVTLKAIVLRRKETSLKHILVMMKVKTHKICFSHVTFFYAKDDFVWYLDSG